MKADDQPLLSLLFIIVIFVSSSNQRNATKTYCKSKLLKDAVSCFRMVRAIKAFV